MVVSTENPSTAGTRRPIRHRHHCGYRANRFMLWLGGSCLPLGYAVVAVAASWFWLTDQKARQASADFLRRVLGSCPRPRRLAQTWRHLRIYGELTLDVSVALAGYEHIHVEPPDIQLIKEALRPDQGLLVLTGHVGCPELAAAMIQGLGQGRRVHIVRYRAPDDPTEYFYRTHWKLLRDVHWINSIHPLSAGVQVMAALRNHDFVGMQADRATHGRSIPVTLLGRRAVLPAGPFTAAVLSRAPVVTAFMLREKRRYYRLHLSPLRYYDGSTDGPAVDQGAAIRRAAEDYVADLEPLLKRYPYQWGNFYKFWELAPPAGSSAHSNSISQTGVSAT